MGGGPCERSGAAQLRMRAQTSGELKMELPRPPDPQVASDATLTPSPTSLTQEFFIVFFLTFQI